MYLRSYSKDCINKDEKIIIPMIENILKLLIDRKSGAKVSAISKFIIQAFKKLQENSKKLKKKKTSSKSEEKDCINCLSNNHNSLSY